MLEARAYLKVAFATVLLTCGAVAATNIVIDPFGAFRLVPMAGVNTAKPAIATRVKLAKAFDIRRIRPEALVLGTSRSHIGLRMTHPGWGGQPTRRYNAAFDGATTKEMYAYLRHAHAVGRLREVVLGLDTWQLGSGPATVRADFDASLLRTGLGSLDWLSVALADARLFANLDTLGASLTTLRGQDARRGWLGADGQRLGDVFFREVEPAFVAGPGDYLRSVDRQEVGYKTAPASVRRGLAAAHPQSPAADTSFEYIARIVEFCRAESIALRLFLTPAHAHQLEIAALVGEWPKIEGGKRALTELIAADAQAHPDERAFRLYDFSGYSSVTTEPVPEPGSRAEMQYYWDSSTGWRLDSRPPLRRATAQTAAGRLRHRTHDRECRRD